MSKRKGGRPYHACHLIVSADRRDEFFCGRYCRAVGGCDSIEETQIERNKEMKSTKTTVKKNLKKAVKKAVKKDENVRTEIVFILDRSGSMSGREQDVIGGFNRMIDDQQKKRGECHVSTVLFNDVSAVLHNRVPISKVRLLTDTEYFVGGGTAYYDALGRGIRHHIYVQRNLPEDKRAEKVLFVVMTDGQENASREYSARVLKKLISEEQKKWGWEFVFIGAGIDAIQSAKDIGIKVEHAINTVADKDGIAVSYCCMCEAITNLREGRGLAENADGSSFREKVDADFKRRNK